MIKKRYYIIIDMKQIGFLFLIPVVLLLACGSGPQTTAPVAEPTPQVQPSPPPVSPPPPVSLPPEPKPEVKIEEKVFDPGTITQERMAEAKIEVQAFIADLNRLIRAKNYNAWRGHLADSYLKEISSQAFLDERTEELYRRDQVVAQNMGRDPKRVQKKILRTPKDYFDNVVVPSRSNDRMDEIDFVSENRVKAYTVNSQGQRLILYDLEIIESNWKIIN